MLAPLRALVRFMKGRSIEVKLMPEYDRALTAVELFAGCGGLLLGSEYAGFKHVAAAEWNHDSCETLRCNQSSGYGFLDGTRILEGDVRDIDWSFIEQDIDLLAGGPPCQPFSLGGLARAALDDRDMFPAFTNVLATLKPRAFIVENVKGLTRQAFADYYNYILFRLQHPLVQAHDGESWRDHLIRLERTHTNGFDDSLRYVVTPTVVDAADYGVPQHRHRVFIVGFRSDVNASWAFPKKTHAKTPDKALGTRPWLTAGEAIYDLPKPYLDSNKRRKWPKGHVLQPGAKPYPGHTGSVMDEPAKAIKAGVHGVPGGENMFNLKNGEYRYMTVREAARIQCFPDHYEICGSWSEAMRQIGNAVPVELGRIVASSVAIALREDSMRKALGLEIDTDYEALINESESKPEKVTQA
jgi:DNA (cytosine-5)-methyltransferase 1